MRNEATPGGGRMIAPDIVTEACCPYPAPPAGDRSDGRRSAHLTKILDGLTPDEIRRLARSYLLLHPAQAQQRLLWIGQDRRPE
jgi:hypothetical protein